MYTELKGRGFGLIAINGLDDKPTVLNFIKEHKLSFPVGLGADSSGQGGEVVKTMDKLRPFVCLMRTALERTNG